MNSVILKIASQILKPLFLVVSVWLLLRGHNYPGGGFIGGLIGGSALIFKPLSASSSDNLSQNSGSTPYSFLALGMGLLLISASIGYIIEGAILKGQWIKFYLPVMEVDLKLGTPLLFDIGIYFTVIGFIYLIIFSMMEEWEWT
jgi:multicomponent Na+:H+ antiporter subunit B